MTQPTPPTNDAPLPSPDEAKVRIRFVGGSLLVDGIVGIPEWMPEFLQADPHGGEGVWVCPGIAYRSLIERLMAANVKREDQAREYKATHWNLETGRASFPHQLEAVEAWWTGGGRGVVVLPTGTGKSHVAELAIARAQRPALVVTPTIDLMQQWARDLAANFGTEVGMLGGGSSEVRPITVTTYDSAYMHVERLGARFGLLVFDECHHLPGQTYSLSAVGSIAPFRLGLTATPERSDQLHEQLDHLIGPIVYRREIGQLKGEFLAQYQVQTMYVQLSDEERFAYENNRELYRTFLLENRIDLRRNGAWGQFLAVASRSPRGRMAFKAFRDYRTIALAAPAKLRVLEGILDRHMGDRVIIFTHDNATVYRIAREFLVPVITHSTKAKERKTVLERFASGDYTVVATSRVLNEGVDVPEANVAVVLSGTSTVREHVQRLGRILRKKGDKQAVLYEIITQGTMEENTSTRRRQHSAYAGPGTGTEFAG
jgi:superfamily II DNA or RNA helicase